MPENWNALFMVIAATLMISVSSLLLQIITFARSRKKQQKELFDEKYVQEFFRAVSAYLDIGYTSETPILSYKSMAADIYRHIPSKHWTVIEKIDQAISTGNHKTAWENLKLLSQSLANDGIEPIRSRQYLGELVAKSEGRLENESRTNNSVD